MSSPPPSTGKSLFSHHYLRTRLPAHPEWAEEPWATFDAVRGLWLRAQEHGDAWNEAQTEDEFVRPVLAALGWSFIVQAKTTLAGRINRPDYALFADDGDKAAAYPHQGHDDAFYSRALAIAEAKYWGRPLSQKDGAGRDAWKSANNPSHQMVSYLVGARCAWGILTNGKIWRLYSREVSSTASEYYEVDLDAVFQEAAELGFSELGFGAPGVAEPQFGNPLDAFKRWWLFFRRAAFTPDSHGHSFVQRVHEGSATYAKEISDKLKELVFREVMPEIAGGFVAYRRHQLGIVTESDESLRQIYQASLSLLYKLLFVLYAEARRLLPIAAPAYWEESLALAITGQAQARYALHRQSRHRILTDLGVPGRALNQKLTAWWALDFPGFMSQVRTAFKRDIPLRQRNDWEEWLASRRIEHEQRTAEIVRLEIKLNARVYGLFDLNRAEIQIVEETTKYQYGAV